uniref:Uncharacterized protein n=1 Tax=Zea mays TaxID=4577 RepID=A0A804LW05_MAIZE
MFDADAPVPVEAHLQKLKEMDNITTKTVSSSSLALLSLPLLPRVLLVLRNLENNLSAPQFEPVRRLLSMYDPTRALFGQL